MDGFVWLIVIIIAVIVTLILYVIRYAINRAVDKGVDAVAHKVNEKKNREDAGNTRNLADRYDTSQGLPQQPSNGAGQRQTGTQSLADRYKNVP